MKVETVTLIFLAPVPRGNQVSHARIRKGHDSAWSALVHDVTTGLVYCGTSLMNQLGSQAGVEDPLRTLADAGWIVERRIDGRSLGAACSAEGDETRTRLVVAIDDGSYR